MNTHKAPSPTAARQKTAKPRCPLPKGARGLAIVFFLIPLLSACVSFPTSARLEMVKTQILGDLQEDVVAQNFQPGGPTFIRIFKEEGVLEVWLKDTNGPEYGLYKTYPICAFSGLLGPKLREGDRQAPEGFYSVSAEWLWPSSDYHLAMNIGYPNTYDASWGRTGSKIMIHGACESEGCFAMTDRQIEEIYLLVEQSLRNGHSIVPIHIFPFRMTEENMQKHQNSQWWAFWVNLRQGYDFFEHAHVPPWVGHQEGIYVFRRPERIYGS